MAGSFAEETDDFRHVVTIVQVAAMAAAGIDNGTRAEDTAEPVDFARTRVKSSTLCIRPSRTAPQIVLNAAQIGAATQMA